MSTERVVRLHESRVQHVIVRTALVAETLTLQVHLEERLLTEPEPTRPTMVRPQQPHRACSMHD